LLRRFAGGGGEIGACQRAELDPPFACLQRLLRLELLQTREKPPGREFEFLGRVAGFAVREAEHPIAEGCPPVAEKTPVALRQRQTRQGFRRGVAGKAQQHERLVHRMKARA
jgi:hypothetical protein